LEREIVILAVTKMRSGVCIAGVDTENGRWMRPVKRFGNISVGDITYRDGQVMACFDVVRFNLIAPRPQPPHVEDWICDFARHRPQRASQISSADRETFLRSCLDAAPDEVLVDQKRSLCLIPADSLQAMFSVDQYSGKYEVRVSFSAGGPQALPVTDLRWRALGRALLKEHGSPLNLSTGQLRRVLGMREVFLAIGRARSFQGQHWPLVVGVHGIPDYQFDPKAASDRRDSDSEAVEWPRSVSGSHITLLTAPPAVPLSKPAAATHPLTGKALAPLETLRDLFGYASFREGQDQVVQNVMSGISTLAVMPTGAGKSLCYQLPAMLLPGVTIVLSPLIALMKDQVDSLPAKAQEKTAVINSTLERDDLETRLAEIAGGRYKLVYAAPERLRQQPFLHALRRAGVSLLVVDEAHCIDLWGHDFRPDYLFVAKARELLGRPTILALTATATPAMRERIAGQLGKDLAIVTTSFFRPNLHFSVVTVANKEQKMRQMLRICHETRGSGIVYVNAREKAENLSRLLRQDGISAAFYHAGMEADQRQETQERFMNGQTRVIVATIAFGMGIDKPDVRFILHYDLPKSLESYSQEAGRAGRDGKSSRCLLLCSPNDKGNLARWAREELVKIDTLRVVYKTIRNRIREPSGYGLFATSDLERDVNDAGNRPVDEAGIPVAISLLEQAGLLVRHCDLPRSLNLTVEGMLDADNQLRSFVEATKLRPRQRMPLNSLELATRTGIALEDLETLLLCWQDEGLITYHGSGREMLLQLQPPPADAAKTMARLLSTLEEAQRSRLEEIIGYATSRSCRHAYLGRHFGERVAKPCGACDICRPARTTGIAAHSQVSRPRQPREEPLALALPPAETVLAALGHLPYPVGKRSLVNILRGSVASPPRTNNCPQFGALALLSASRVEALIERLVQEGYVAYFQRGEYRLLAATDKERETPLDWPEFAPRRREAKSKFRDAEPLSDQEIDQTLCDLLRVWRRDESTRQGVPPFMVLHDAVIREIATFCPRDMTTLAAVRGMGPAKLAQYGESILRLINRASERYGGS